MLVGWFLVSTASVEFAVALMRERLAGVRVADVMSRDPTIARGWWTAQTFLEGTAASSEHRVFPVVEFDGHPAGVVSLADLGLLNERARAVTKVSEVCRPVPAEALAAPQDPLASVITRAPVRPGRDLLLVVDHGLLVGVISAEDVQRMSERRALGLRRGP